MSHKRYILEQCMHSNKVLIGTVHAFEQSIIADNHDTEYIHIEQINLLTQEWCELCAWMAYELDLSFWIKPHNWHTDYRCICTCYYLYCMVSRQYEAFGTCQWLLYDMVSGEQGKLPNAQPCSKVRPFFGLSKFWGTLWFFPLVSLFEIV